MQIFLVCPTTLLVHLEVDFLFHGWYYFLVFKLEHILCHEALNYCFKFLPNEVLSSHIRLESLHCQRRASCPSSHLTLLHP